LENRWISWIGPALLAACFVALTVWSWRKWPDPLIDFGRELYVPWQLASGKVLYRDIASLFGPLASCWNAWLFALFGESLTTLVLWNLAVLAGLTFLVYRIFATAADRLTATSAALVLLCLFGFSQYLRVGNYNFVTPYSHEATLGLALGILMVFAFARAQESSKPSRVLIAGLCFGLGLLTKPDILLAMAAVAVPGLIFLAGIDPWRRTRLFAAGAAFPLLLFFIYFRLHMSTWQALRGVLGAFLPAISGGVQDTVFYRQVMGLDQPAANLRRMLGMFAALAALPVLAAACEAAAARLQRILYRCAAAAAATGVLATVLWFSESVNWAGFPRALPLVAAGAVLTFTRNLIVERRRAGHPGGSYLRLMWAAFSFVLLAKIALNTHIFHYGFYLALPATLLLVLVLLDDIPRRLAARFGRAALYRAIILAVFTGGVVFHLRWADGAYALKTVSLGNGEDRFFTEDLQVRPEGIAAAKALQLIEEMVPRNATLAVLPEGVMLNYLSRRRNPTPYVNLMLPEMAFFGEGEILAAFRAQPPDFIILAHRETGEYGVGYFGADPRYGRDILAWVEANYRSVALIGAEPLRDGQYGMKLLKRKP